MKRLWRITPLRFFIILFILCLVCAGSFFIWFFNLIPQPHYSAGDFGIETIYSPYDANSNGVDDFTDLMLGARQDAQHQPRYDGAYHEGGYPPGDVGVCTDLFWRALDHAGYDFKELIDEDIREYPHLYPGLDAGGPDPNIDFRRVRNVKIYLDRHARSLTLDLNRTDQWQPGDIVTFSGHGGHIGILSDKRNKNGVPWLIHNGGQPNREEDALEKLLLYKEISGHYRWITGDGSKII